MKTNLLNWFRRNTTPFLLSAALLALALATQIIGNTLLERIVTVLFINVILVLGLQVFMGNSGILSFAHIGFMGIGAYSSVLLSMTPEAKAITLPELYPAMTALHLPFWPSILIGAVFAGLVAAIISYPVMRLSDAAAVITIFALLVIIHNVLVHWDRVTNGPRTLFGVDRYTYLWTGAVCGILVVFIAHWFKESAVGLMLRASRDDAYAASAVGINIIFMRYIGFVLSAVLAGFGGGLFAHFITSFSPSAFYLSETFAILAMLVVGGPFGVTGAVLGTVVVTLVREGLRFLENSINMAQLVPGGVSGLSEVFLSLALIYILIRRPTGLMGGREWLLPSRRKPENNDSQGIVEAKGG